MAIKWTDDLKTGNEQIDSEHKSLIEAVNKLLDACSQGKGRAEISGTVKFLKNYTKTHFGHEEELQKKYCYPDYENHVKYHKGFIKIVQDISDKLEKTGPTVQLVGEINMQMGNWLTHHIKNEDVKVAKHIMSNNK